MKSFGLYYNIEDCPDMVKDAIQFLVGLFGEDCTKSMDLDGIMAVVSYPNAGFEFRFFEIGLSCFSLEVVENNTRILIEKYTDIADYYQDMESGHCDGFETEFGDIIRFTPISAPVFIDTDDEEDSSTDTESEVVQDTKLSSQKSIVPDGIMSVRVVALRFGGRVIAFRFKTDKGAFDMRIEVAAKYGLSDFKTEKFIALERVNGILMSSTEKKLRTCVPDVSLCEEDCIKLIGAIFEG